MFNQEGRRGRARSPHTIDGTAHSVADARSLTEVESGNEYNSKFETRESRAAHIHDVLSIEIFLPKRRASHQQYTQHAGEQDGPVSRVHLALTTRQMGG